MTPAAEHRYVSFAADFPCPPLYQAWERLAALAAPLFYWQGREPGAESWLGLGAAARFRTLTEARAMLAAAEANSGLPIRVFAAIPFDPSWAGGAILLPELFIRWQAGRASLFSSSTSGQLAAHVVDLLAEPEAPHTLPQMVDGGRLYSYTEWAGAIGELRSQMAAGEISKAVLARDSFRIAQRPVPVSALLEKLSDATPGSYRIAFGTAERSFVSASPERLFQLDGRELTTESLAGTRPRGTSPEDDARLAAELLQSEKDRREQKMVTDFLAAELDGLCEYVEIAREPVVRKLAAVQHLVTPVRAVVRADISLDRILGALHPTPAVCGLPREAARRLIARLEAGPRGFYAGALGWIGTQAAEFAVGIRSAVVERQTVTIYAGAGIVAESEPVLEWKETSWKMSPMLHALGCAHP